MTRLPEDQAGAGAADCRCPCHGDTLSGIHGTCCDPEPEPQPAEARLAIAVSALRRLSLIDEMAGMGQRDDDPELKARCRYAARALEQISGEVTP